MNQRIARVLIEEQARGRSPLFWVGVIGCIAQIVCGVLAANEIINEQTVSAIMCGMGGLFLWCNANNPSIKDELQAEPEPSVGIVEQPDDEDISD